MVLLPVALLASLTSSCATIDYVGETYQPTQRVEVFFAHHNQAVGFPPPQRAATD